MLANEGMLLTLTGGSRLTRRVQHPKVHERKDRGTHYWFFRYRSDEVLPDGAVRTTRKFHTIGSSRGVGAISKRQAEIERDNFLAELNAAPSRCEAAVAAKAPIDPDMIIFGKLAGLWRTDYVEREVGGKPLLAASTHSKYTSHLENHILPRWQDTRLGEFRTKEITDWLQTTCQSWYAMDDLRNIMSGIFTKAIEWQILPESYANPINRVKLPPKWSVRERRILSEEKTVAVLARLEDPYSTTPGPRNCLRVSQNMRPCEKCGSTPAVLHTPIRAPGRYCAACCPHCSPPAQPSAIPMKQSRRGTR